MRSCGHLLRDRLQFAFATVPMISVVISNVVVRAAYVRDHTNECRPIANGNGADTITERKTLRGHAHTLSELLAGARGGMSRAGLAGADSRRLVVAGWDAR